MILLLASTALAAPDRLASTFFAGTDVTDITVTDDGLFAGWVENASSTLTVLDTGSFDPFDVSVCTAGARGVAVTGDDTKGWTFYVGCDDGTVALVDVSLDGDVTENETTLTVGTGQVWALETDGTTLWAIVEEEGGMVAAAVTLADGKEVAGFGQTLSSDTIEDTTLTTDSLIVVHGGDEVSKVSRTAGTAIFPQSSLGRTLVDAFPYAAGSAVYLADEGGGLVRFENDNDYVPLTVTGDTTTAVGIHPEEGWMVLGAGEDGLLYDFDGGTLSEVGPIEGAAGMHDIVVIDGYALAATDTGSVLVLTDRPWVNVETVSPSSALDGDTITLSFSSDTAGTYEVYVGGTADKTGTKLSAGDGEVAALTTETVTFTVNGDDYIEGNNKIWVFVTAGGLVGRGAGILSVDNPPEKVRLDEGDVGFGNGQITVAFDGLEAADIAGYIIYIDVEPFTAAEYASGGGPGFTGTDRITAPLLVTAEPGARVSRTISPLTNGTTYYVAVRGVDENANEGPMSDVQSAMPEETFCATCLANDPGGHWGGLCGTTGRGSAGLLGIGLAAAALLRRRKAVAFAGLLAVGIVPSAAQAATDDEEGPRTMNVQLRYGPTTIADPFIKQIYGDDPNEILWFEYGFASRFVDINLGIGFYQELGYLQTLDGRVSDEHDMFTMFPLTLSATGRLDLLDEQPIVPFGRVGVDYWMWRENWYVADEGAMENERTGGKPGWHFGGGLLILLDVLDRRSASKLEATTGINDTYLVAEYRKTNLMHGENQVNLSSSEFTFGLKFDF